MAKHTITRACGHEEVIQIVGPYRDRERKAEYEASRSCKDCYMASKERDREMESAKAAELAKAAGLPPLNGSPKQIAWAESIRANYLSQVAAIEPQIAANIGAPGASQAAEALPKIKAQAEALTSAHEWIERRDHSAASDLRDAVRALLG